MISRKSNKQMKILLATDGSAHSKAMVKNFSERNFAPNTKVRIISAYDGSSSIMNVAPMGVMTEYYADADKYLKKSAENAGESAAIILQKENPKFSVSVAVIDGSAKSVILQEAEKFGANLIVVGSHGHSAVAGFLLGSVSQAVALHAKCSVEIVRNGKQQKMKILLATDGSANSKAMIKQFAGRSFAPNTKVHVISVYEIYPYLMNISSLGLLDEYNVIDDKYSIKTAKAATEMAMTILRKLNPKLSITSAVTEGSPKVVILEEAEKFAANLIVVGSHGQGPIAGFLLGSVAQAVALHAKCSVEIVRNAKTKK